MPTALLACTQPWHSPFQVGSHHIARALAARGWRVGFVSAPVTPLHRIGRGQDAAARVAAWRTGGQIDAASGVWHLVPFAPLPWTAGPFSRSAAATRLAWAACRPALARALAAAGFDRPDLGYADHFLLEGLVAAARPRLTVYRRADNVAAFPGAPAGFAARDRDFARRADLTICPTASAAADLAAAGVAAPLVMPNGVALGRFVADAPLPDEYRGDARPVVVYAGETEVRFDPDLMVHAATALPTLRWVVVGPAAARTAARLRAAGVEVLGPRPHERLPGYLQHAQVGVVPFTTTRHASLIRDVNPLKVLEYAASGLPVVGTAGCRYPDTLPVPLAVCADAAAFVAAVARCAAAPKPPRPPAEALAPFGWDARLAPLLGWLASRGVSGAPASP